MKSLLKENKMLIRGGSLFLTALLVLFFTTSCNNLVQVQEEKASLVVTVPGSRAASDNIKSYKVSVIGAAEKEVATARVEVGGTASFSDIAPGAYTVVVQGYDSKGAVIFKGENKVIVVAGESTSVVIELKGTSFNVTLYSNIDGAAPVTQTINYGEKLPALSSSKGDGYTLVGWTEKKDGSGIVYNPDTPVIFTEDIILYAQWSVGSFEALKTEVTKGGTVKISGDITVTETLSVTKPVSIMASSQAISLTGERTIFDVKEGGKLILEDNVSISAGTPYGRYGVKVADGTFTMNGGTILNNYVGVSITSDSVFTMNGGSISNNNFYGVTVTDSSFIMKGGAIGGANQASVYISGEKPFSISGAAKIEGDNGVKLGYNQNSQIAASINVAGPLNNTSSVVKIILESGYPINEQIIYAGDGVNLAEEVGKFSVTDDSGSKYTITSTGMLEKITEVTNESELKNALSTGGIVKISNDITITSGLTVSNNVTLIAGSSEVTLTNASSTSSPVPLFTVGNGTTQGKLTLGDGKNSLILDGNLKSTNSVLIESGELVINNKVTITKAAGSGVKVEGGTFTMYGGSIKGNISGGVYVQDGGNFTMDGGMITSNTSSSNGGGVYVAGTFTMNNGTITNNTAFGSGGGIYVFSDGTFDMNGGTITGNKFPAANTNRKGKGVYVASPISSTTDFSMSGSARITDDNDVYLNVNSNNSVVITVDEDFDTTTETVATITPVSYVGMKVLGGAKVAEYYKQFAVTASSDGKNWEIDSSGYLQESTP